MAIPTRSGVEADTRVRRNVDQSPVWVVGIWPTVGSGGIKSLAENRQGRELGVTASRPVAIVRGFLRCHRFTIGFI